MKKGRKPRNPIEKLRTLMYVHQVFIDSGLMAKTPSAFGKLFEPHKADNCYQGDKRFNRKWEPIIRGDASPNLATRKAITQIIGCDTAEHLYTSILWKVLQVGEFSSQYWLKLLKSEELLYRDKSGVKQVSATQIGFEKCQKIGLQGSLEGLACLLVLLRYEQSIKEPCYLILALVEDVLFRTLTALCTKEPFREFFSSIWLFICTHINDQASREYRFYRIRTLPQVNSFAMFMSVLEHEAKIVGLISNDRDNFIFRFFAPRCNLVQLYFELIAKVNVTSSNEISVSGFGLLWLIDQMDRLQPNRYHKNFIRKLSA